MAVPVAWGCNLSSCNILHHSLCKHSPLDVHALGLVASDLLSGYAKGPLEDSGFQFVAKTEDG